MDSLCAGGRRWFILPREAQVASLIPSSGSSLL